MFFIARVLCHCPPTQASTLPTPGTFLLHTVFRAGLRTVLRTVVSTAALPVNTNDGFVGFDSETLKTGGSTKMLPPVWDAGEIIQHTYVRSLFAVVLQSRRHIVSLLRSDCKPRTVVLHVPQISHPVSYNYWISTISSISQHSWGVLYLRFSLTPRWSRLRVSDLSLGNVGVISAVYDWCALRAVRVGPCHARAVRPRALYVGHQPLQ